MVSESWAQDPIQGPLDFPPWSPPGIRPKAPSMSNTHPLCHHNLPFLPEQCSSYLASLLHSRDHTLGLALLNAWTYALACCLSENNDNRLGKGSNQGHVLSLCTLRQCPSLPLDVVVDVLTTPNTILSPSSHLNSSKTQNQRLTDLAKNHCRSC